MKKIRNKEINMFTINAYMKMSPAEKLKLLEENIKFYEELRT
jgi:membrane-bound lytic murein transglycosylase